MCLCVCVCVCVCLTECDLGTSKRGGPGPELAASQEKYKTSKQAVTIGGRVNTSNFYCHMIRNVFIVARRHMHAPARISL